MKKQLLLAVVLTTVIGSANAQSLRDATVAMTKGDWKVLRSQDPMTDKSSCTAIYKENYQIQLSPENLFIGISGGIQSVTLRFDDNPPSRLRLATDMEKKLRSIIITGSDFSRLRTSQRLRYQSSTLVSGMQTGEIDLSDFGPVIANIEQGCPAGQSTSTQPAKQSSASCSTELIKRMKGQGLSPEQILAICQ